MVVRISFDRLSRFGIGTMEIRHLSRAFCPSLPGSFRVRWSAQFVDRSRAQFPRYAVKHLAQLIQLLAQKAHTISRLFIDKAFDGFELEDRRAHALAGLVMEVMRKTKPFLLLRAHDAATEIVPFGRALIDQIMCRL